MWGVYLVECSDKSLYCGYSDNIHRRIELHNKGTGAKYTRSRRPVKLVYSENYSSKNEAMKREYAIKQLTRCQKLNLIDGCSGMENETLDKYDKSATI